MNAIDDLKKEAIGAVREAATLTALRSVEVEYLGRSGRVTTLLKNLKNIREEERRAAGKEANELREILQLEVAARQAELKRDEFEKKLALEKIDITQPGKKIWKGGLHPLSILQREIERIFSSLGFAVVEGPEIETEWYNFDALNIPADHPARDMWDTFWLRSDKKVSSHQPPATSRVPEADSREFSKSKKLLLRTHTSPMQVRYMETHQPPLRIIVPGRVFRYEATDASHDIQFYQLEGLMVGKNISLANLKEVMATFLAKLFLRGIRVRFRPSYFPFVEPGVEVDMSCLQCAGYGCSVCKKTGWLEMAGAGMVHPKVFEAAGYNPKEWQGFAFGFGIDRIALMKYKIPDIRYFYQNDMRFLKQF